MIASHAAILGFIALTVILALAVVAYRAFCIFAKRVPANSWTRDTAKHENPAWVTRATHAQLNCLENLPLLGLIILYAGQTNQLAVTNGLALIYLGARIAQSVTHLIGTSAMLVFIRANFYFVQMGILVYWLLKLAGLL